MLGLDIDVNAYQYCENQQQLKMIEIFYKQRHQNQPTNLSVYDQDDNILRFTFNRKNQITLKELIKAEMKYRIIIIEHKLIKQINKKLKELEQELKKSELMLKEPDSAENIWFTIEKKQKSSATLETYSIVKIDITNLTIADQAFIKEKAELYSQIFDIEKTRQNNKMFNKKEPKRMGSFKPEPINPNITEKDLQKLIMQILAKDKYEKQLFDVEITCQVSNFIKVGMQWVQQSKLQESQKKPQSRQVNIAEEQFKNFQLRLLQRIQNITDFLQKQAQNLVDYLEYLEEEKQQFNIQNIREQLISNQLQRAGNKMIKILIKNNLLNYIANSNEEKQEKIRIQINSHIYNLFIEEKEKIKKSNFDIYIIETSVYLFYNTPLKYNTRLVDFGQEIKKQFDILLNNIEQQLIYFTFPVFSRKETQTLFLKYKSKNNIYQNNGEYKAFIQQLSTPIIQKIEESSEFKQRNEVIVSALTTLYNSINKTEQDLLKDFFQVYNEKLQQPNFEIMTAIQEIFESLIKKYLLELQEEF